jgi:hypothetical protein
MMNLGASYQRGLICKEFILVDLLIVNSPIFLTRSKLW